MRHTTHSPQGTRGSLAPPSTPGRRNGAELSALIRRLGEQWQLGLPVRDATWSPLKSSKGLPDKVYDQLKRAYWKGQFHEVVGKFWARVGSVKGRDERLRLLMSVVGEVEREKVGTGVVREVSSTLGSHPSTPSSGAHHAPRGNNASPYYATAPDPGSPTDEDEPPPSPIASSRSAQRRVQANPHYQLGAIAKKRSSDSSDSGNSSKLTRTSQGKQAPDQFPIPPPVFKTPSLSQFRSHQAQGSFNTISLSQRTQPDMAQSFESSSANPSFDTVLSSQKTQPDTAATSFASDYRADTGPKVLEWSHFRKRTSSTTIGSLNDQDLLNADAAEAQLQRESTRLNELGQGSQDVSRSSSTYGSVDEDDMVQTSFSVEVEEGYKVPVLSHRLPPRSDRAFESPPIVRTALFPRTPSGERSPFNQPHDREHRPYSTTMSSTGVVGQPSMTSTSPQPKNTISGPPPSKKSSRSPSTAFKESPAELPLYVRGIPEGNLFTEPIAEELKAFPYFVLFICSRLADEHNMPLSTILRGVDASNALANAPLFLEQVCSNLNISVDVLRDQQRLWSAWKRDFEGYTFKARVVYHSPETRNPSTPVFSLQILPIQAEKSCRFQRKFGSDRILYVNIPSFESSEDTPVRYTNGDLKNIQNQFVLWCEREHMFLGRKWRAFHVEPIKKKKRTAEDLSDKRIVMFATEGHDIDQPMTIGDMLSWFFPFEENMHQAFCKAFARLDLGLSRTIPTLTFAPSQIIFVKDITADGTAEDTRFDDNTIDSWPHDYPRDAVMSDGCSRISVGAALLIWQKVRKATNSADPMPSAFQGRIGGAKGVWMISGEPSFAGSNKHDIWIEISESQLKFKPPQEDRDDNPAADPHRLTFEHVDHSRTPVSSELHISFIPILVDRGVPQEVIANQMVEQLDTERKELLQLLPTIDRLYQWVCREGPSGEGMTPRWQAGMFQSLPYKIKHLFESGFEPTQEPFLADCLCRFIKQRQIRMESKLRVPLSRSTFVLGIADPLGVLKPGEVHMEFSTPFQGDLDDGRFRSLENMDILVTRQPACRRSDIQKVRAVKCSELSHLVDVVVFPSRGQYPLAGKLQGGDYDGDTFWLCWDQAIVEPFKNAPAPVISPDPAQYGIEQDARKLPAVMDPNDLSTVANWINEAFGFRLAPSLLGIVTTFLDKQAYHENRVYSDRLDKLCDLHDLLVDAPKQGFKFTDEDFAHFTRKVLRCGNPKKPPYKEAMEDCETFTDRKEKGDADKKRKANYKHNKNNVLDHLYFEIVRTHDVATLKMVDEFFSKEFGEDPDPVLTYPYQHLRSHGSPAVQKELDILIKNLKAVERKWLDIIHTPERRTDWFTHTIEFCYDLYTPILPTQTDHPDIAPWIYPYQRERRFFWEHIRASAFYAVFTKRHKLVWLVAGKQLAELKVGSYPGATAVIPRIKAIMRPRAPKALRPEGDDSEEEEFGTALEEWDVVPSPRIPVIVGGLNVRRTSTKVDSGAKAVAGLFQRTIKPWLGTSPRDGNRGATTSPKAQERYGTAPEGRSNDQATVGAVKEWKSKRTPLSGSSGSWGKGKLYA